MLIYQNEAETQESEARKSRFCSKKYLNFTKQSGIMSWQCERVREVRRFVPILGGLDGHRRITFVHI